MRTTVSIRHAAALAALAAALALAGCSKSGETRAYTPGSLESPGGPMATEANRPSGARADFAQGPNATRAATVRVNRFAWRAALDSIAFMPLASSDPYGGAISTDWYIARGAPNERLRVNILVGGPELRGDTVKVTVFRQERRGGRGDWVNATVEPTTGQNLENVILQRARDLRNQGG